MANIEQAGPVHVSGGTPKLTPEQQTEAQKVSVQAFLQDLATCCQQQPVVIMLDAYERCQADLQQWLRDHLLGPHCFDLEQRPDHLLLVLAGRAIPEFELYWSLDDCRAVVRSVKSLSKWTAAHVEECLQVHGYGYTQQQLKTFCDMIEMGLPPSQVVQAMSFVFTHRSI